MSNAAFPAPSRPRRRRRGDALVRYLAHLSGSRFVLWCYFIYWLVIAIRYFDPHPQLWATSVGLSLIIGLALYLNTRSGQGGKLGKWPTFRLFLTPFCVSSFAALVKDRGFVLIFSPEIWTMVLAASLWLGLGVAVWISRRATPR